MSDQKRYEQMMGRHVDGQIRREREQEYTPQRKYSPEAQQYFNRPAVMCQICGDPMSNEPRSQAPHQITEWERKWSVHKVCAVAVQDQLDQRMNRSNH